MPANWLRVSATSPSDEHAVPLVEGLLACGGSAIEERGDRFITYIAAEQDTEAQLQRIRGALAGVLGGEPPELDAEEVPEEDWLAVWRAGLGPRRLGDRLVVAPTWSDVQLEAHERLVRIDPQMAFGTGEHASTRGVLRLMQGAVEPGSRLLDVGSGSGILAIAAMLLGADAVIAVEADPEALPNAVENIERNGVAAGVTLLCELVDEPFLDGYGPAAFDGILANVLSSVLRPLLPGFHRALRPRGWTILSGILAEESGGMRQAAAGAGFEIEAEDTEEQWWSVLLRRRS